MMTVKLCTWSIWLPGLPSRPAFKQWLAHNLPLPPDEGSPEVAFLPALFRRRLSRFGKMGLTVARDCLGERDPSTCRSVFGSRHGEMTRTLRLLEQLAEQAALSPTDFALSIHSSVAGLFSIWANNQQPSTTISAGRETVAASLLEALAQATLKPAQPVLLILADEALPDVYVPYADEPMTTCSLALLLQGSGDETAINWRFAADLADNTAGEPQVLHLARWLAQPTAPLILPLNGGAMILELATEAAS
jgi:hypothetical protein